MRPSIVSLAFLIGYESQRHSHLLYLLRNDPLVKTSNSAHQSMHWPRLTIHDSEAVMVHASIDVCFLAGGDLSLLFYRAQAFNASFSPTNDIHRHAPRCSRNFPSNASSQASYDVQCNTLEGDPHYVQKVYGECKSLHGFYMRVLMCIGSHLKFSSMTKRS